MLNVLSSFVRLSRIGVPVRAAMAAGLLAAAILSGCGTLDPTGEWRGLDRLEAAGAPARVQSVVAQAPVPALATAAPEASAVVSVAASDRAATIRGDRPRSVSGETAESLENLYARAEAHYRGRRYEDAHRDFERLVSREPRALHGWFRLGNLNHARGDLTAAVYAYRKAIDLVPGNAIEFDSREKALANLAIIGLEQARVALEKLGERQASEVARGRAEALAPLFDQRQAAVHAELARFSPRATQTMEPARLGRPGDSGSPVFRVESHPPVSPSR
jgi:tetratricopeptide (TPR) repeat protein